MAAGSTARKQRVEREPCETVSGLEELNFVEFPFALLSKRIPEGLKTLRFADTIKDAASGEIITRRVMLSTAEASSLPTWQDQDVLLALMKHTRETNDFASVTVPFTLYQICKQLRWPTTGPYCNRVKVALRKWNALWITFENSFRRNKKWTSERGFHLVSYYELTKGEDFDPQREQTFDWHKVVAESVRASHTKGLDWNFYLSLQLPSSKRLYRLLDKRFWDKDRYSPLVEPFCQEKMGYSRDYKPNRYCKLLLPAIDELTAKGFLAEGSQKNAFKSLGRGVYKVDFRARHGKRKRGRPAASESKPSELEMLLIERGVRSGGGKTGARTVAARASEERIRFTVELFDYYRSIGAEKSPGFVVAGCLAEKPYTAPKGFTSKAERDAVEQKQEERLLVAGRKKAEEKRKELVDLREQREAKARYEEFRNQFSEEEFAKLEESSLKVAMEAGETVLVNLVRAARDNGEYGATRRIFCEQYVMRLYEKAEC